MFKRLLAASNEAKQRERFAALVHDYVMAEETLQSARQTLSRIETELYNKHGTMRQAPEADKALLLATRQAAEAAEKAALTARQKMEAQRDKYIAAHRQLKGAGARA